MFSWLKKQTDTQKQTQAEPTQTSPTQTDATDASAAPTAPAARATWMQRLKQGLARTGNGIGAVFGISTIDEEWYEALETALLQSDAGMAATTHILQSLKERVRNTPNTEVSDLKRLLQEEIADLLSSLQAPLVLQEKPTVIMVVGVNGAGKTTSIGKLSKYLSDAGASVLLAAADTFRAAAKEQLMVWADRNSVEIISQEQADPASVAFDAVIAGKARAKDVVMVDTAGRLATQTHLMEELKKVQRVITKAQADAPHETLLVIDGNTGQNALAQVQAFDKVLNLSGLIVTKLDGTAKGGILLAIALWAKTRTATRPLAVYFIGVGETLEDLQTFDAKEFAQALVS